MPSSCRSIDRSSKTVEQLLLVAGVEVLAAGRLGQVLHHLLVDLAGPAQAEHVQRHAGPLRLLDDLLDAVPAAGRLVHAVGQHDHGPLPLRPRRLQRQQRVVGRVVQQGAAVRLQLVDAALERRLVGAERLGLLDPRAERQQRRAGAGPHEVHEAAGGPVQRLDLAALVLVVGALGHAAAVVQHQHRRHRLAAPRLADAQRVDRHVLRLGLLDDLSQRHVAN